MSVAARHVITPVGRAPLVLLAIVVACGDPAAAVMTGPDPVFSTTPEDPSATPRSPAVVAPPEAPTPRTPEAPAVAPELPPEAPPPAPTLDPSLGVAPPAVRWSGLRVLFLVNPGWEARDDEPAMPPHATPVACTDGRAWLSLAAGCGELAAGTTVGAIAEQLHLSVNTVSTYRARVLEKLGAANNAELMRYAAERRLV